VQGGCVAAGQHTHTASGWANNGINFLVNGVVDGISDPGNGWGYAVTPGWVRRVDPMDAMHILLNVLWA
jgi:hypothetical protein